MRLQITSADTYDYALRELKCRLLKQPGLGAKEDSGPLDPTIALCDAWAVAFGVLGFYEERLVNESYVSTANEDRSIFELARMVGYTPDQGLSASCYVYYTIDKSVTTAVTIPARSRIRAAPLPGEATPIIFETKSDLTAWAQLSDIRLSALDDGPIDLNSSQLYFSGASTGLKVGDTIWISHPEACSSAKRTTSSWKANREPDIHFTIKSVAVNREAAQTVVEVAPRYPNWSAEQVVKTFWKSPTGSDPELGPASTETSYQMQIDERPWVAENTLNALKAAGSQDNLQPGVKALGFRRSFMVFGHSAPRRLRNPRSPSDGDEAWELDDLDKTQLNTIDLEGHIDTLVPGAYITIEIPNRTVHGEDIETYVANNVQLTSRTAYGLTGNVTRITLDRPWKSSFCDEVYEEVVQRPVIRIDAVALQIEKPPQRTLKGDCVELDSVYFGINPGHVMLLQGGTQLGSGMETQEPEIVEVAKVIQPPYPFVNGQSRGANWHVSGKTKLLFTKNLLYEYNPSTVRIFGNVVEATHGESYDEVLGDGVGSQSYQAFALSRKPIARLGTSKFPGSEPELAVTIDGDVWRRVDTLAEARGDDRSGARGDDRAGARRDDRVFQFWSDEKGTSRVIFGSGQYGARLPTGREIVKAGYRIGIGASGNVSRDRLKLAVDHPIGVRQVSNSRASGGADPEPMSGVRLRAPISTVALERLVSAEDYQCAARAFPGITKARATRLSSRDDTVVISILGSGILSGDAQSCGLLQAAMTSGQDGGVRVLVLPGNLCPLIVAAKIKPLAGASWESTKNDVQAALIALFCFERREIGQTAYASQALATIQAVKTVGYASLTAFCRFKEVPKLCLHKAIVAFGGGAGDNGAVKGGEMLLIQPHISGSIVLEQA